jgi:SnoaL-like domain
MATYPTHGVHLRQRHPNRWLLVAIAVVAALVGAGAWALVDHYTGGTTETTTEPATLTSRGIASKYIAALERLHPYALTPILAKNAVSIDWPYGSSPFHSAKALERNWANVFNASGDVHFRASLRAAAPNWAAVTHRTRGSTNPLTYKPFTMNGLSILDTKNGKIVRETYYYDVPGRNPGIAATVGSKYATALAAHQPGWGLTLGSLFSKNGAAEVDMATYGQVTPVSGDSGLMWGRWANPSLLPADASLCCAGPSYRMDNGKMRNSWAVVKWVAQVYPAPGKVSGISILQLNRQGKIIRETLYY